MRPLIDETFPPPLLSVFGDLHLLWVLPMPVDWPAIFFFVTGWLAEVERGRNLATWAEPGMEEDKLKTHEALQDYMSIMSFIIHIFWWIFFFVSSVTHILIL